DSGRLRSQGPHGSDWRGWSRSALPDAASAPRRLAPDRNLFLPRFGFSPSRRDNTSAPRNSGAVPAPPGAQGYALQRLEPDGDAHGRAAAARLADAATGGGF